MPALTYYGHSCFTVECEGMTLVIDPFITGNPHTPVSRDELKVDYVLLSHGHPDHLGDGIAIAKRCAAPVIAPFELATYCERQGAQAHPMHIGGGYNFPFGRVKLTIAVHGSGLPTDEGILYLGNPCGFCISSGGKTIYHAGDTGLFLDMKLIGELETIDVALLPIGGNFTMDIDDALMAAEFLNARMVIPMHYDTFDLIKADPADFAGKAGKRGISARVAGIGERLEV